MAASNRRKTRLIPRSTSPGLTISWEDDSRVEVGPIRRKRSRFVTRPILEPEQPQVKNVTVRNPMTVHLVLDEVMKYLELDTLKACRLVNTLWNNRAASLIRNRHAPIQLDRLNQIQLFQSLLKNCTDLPFQNYKFQCRYTLRIQKCFETIGPTIKSIQITSWDKFRITFADIFKMLKNMPNVKKLMLVNIEFPKLADGLPMPTHATLTAPPPIVCKSIETLNFSGWFMDNSTLDLRPLNMHAQQFIADVLNAAPHVKRLELDIFRASVVQNFMVGIGRLTRLESLSVRSLEEKDLTYLLRSATDLPNLKSVTFGEVHLNHHGITLLEALKILAEKLVYLDIRVLSTRAVEIVHFPQMNALQTLHLDTYPNVDRFTLDASIPATSMPIHTPFPALKKFTVSELILRSLMLTNFRAPCVTDMIIKMNGPPLNNLQNLVQMPGSKHAREIHIFQYLPIAFPALKKIKVVNVPQEDTGKLFGSLSQLQIEAMEICHDFQPLGIKVDMNPGLTGLEVPALNARMLNTYFADPTTSLKKKAAALEFVLACSKDSIRSMKSLKKLILSGPQCIDSCSVQLALLLMQPLNMLVFTENAVSPYQFLKEKIYEYEFVVLEHFLDFQKCFGDEELMRLKQQHKVVQVKKALLPQIHNFFTF